MRTILVPPGIGDALWVFMKLINTGERFYVVMPGGSPRRGHQLAELLPDLIDSITYDDTLSYRKIRQQNIQQGRKEWQMIHQGNFALEANTHLEYGKRIERFLPDLPTSFSLPFIGASADKYPSGWIAIYTSAYSNARHWGQWGPDEWFKLMERVGGKYILIGAPYDVGITEELTAKLDEAGIEYISSIGEPLPVVVEILRQSKYFIGFPSGLSILCELIGTPNFMHYPPHLLGMIDAWPDPARIADGRHIGRIGATPEMVYGLIKDKV